MPAPRPFGLILAGGQATRMGGLRKPLALVGGVPILARVMACLGPQCETVAISTRGEAAPWSDYAGCVLVDPGPDSLGPLAGVLAGLRHLDRLGRGEQLLLTVPGDAPFLPGDLADRLAAVRTTAATATAVAGSGGREHHVVALWPVTVRAALEEFLLVQKRRSVGAFHAVIGRGVADWDVAPHDPFLNVNTPDDLRRADHLARSFGS